MPPAVAGYYAVLAVLLLCLFDLILDVPVKKILSNVGTGLPGLNQYLARIMAYKKLRNKEFVSTCIIHDLHCIFEQILEKRYRYLIAYSMDGNESLDKKK